MFCLLFFISVLLCLLFIVLYIILISVLLCLLQPEDRKSPETESLFMPLPPTGPSFLPIYGPYMGRPELHNIPYPRTCGARFCGAGRNTHYSFLIDHVKNDHELPVKLCGIVWRRKKHMCNLKQCLFPLEPQCHIACKASTSAAVATEAAANNSC